MSSPTPNSQPLLPHQVVLADARACKRALDEVIRPLHSKKSAAEAEDSADYWDMLWRTAEHLRLKADKLAVFAARQGQAARERAHPDNQPPLEQR